MRKCLVRYFIFQKVVKWCIYKLNKCKSLEEAFKVYYDTGYEALFLQFTNSWSESQIYDLTKAARDFFAEYVIDMRGKEDKKIWKEMAKLRK